MLITDLDFIKIQAKKKERENMRFRTFVKGLKPSKKTDEIAHALAETISVQIDCTTCGNCCKELMPSMSDAEIETVSTHLQMTKETFIHSFLQFSADDQAHFTKHSPCSFLDDNKCTIYEFRPESCRDYPNLHKEGFSYRMLGVVQNYGICPIVYNVVERLKLDLNFEANEKA